MSNRSQLFVLAAIAFLSAISWAFFIWGASHLHQIGIAAGGTDPTLALLSERSIWIVVIIWPLTFIGLAVICGHDR